VDGVGTAGQPIEERFWLDMTGPHFSTWPANIAANASGLQGAEVGDHYLRRLRPGGAPNWRHNNPSASRS
jgi:hypothetical protein